MLAAIGATLIFAQWSAQVNPPVIFLAISSATSLAIVEFVYVARRVISPVYLGDAFVEVLLIAWGGEYFHYVRRGDRFVYESCPAFSLTYF